MVDVVLFHHVQGLTPGVRALAAALAGTEHTVHTPDLYGGRTFATLADGLARARSLDAPTLRREVDALVDALPGPLVHAGISWGVLHAQRLAQTRPGALGALLLEACLPVGEDGFGPWPAGLPVQVHGVEDDESFAGDGDLAAARDLAERVGPQHAQVFTYPGCDHLVLDASLPTHDPGTTALVVQRARDLLARL
ncbi:dienelactone hydrolase family protein [Kineococcus gypseus]|uniref:dienelactone hydrolase family protein n=1 Tax=Kineococcus gypseus TaxID=1637102 RepID=UPI003D7C49A8